MKAVGKSVPRKEAFDKVTGVAKFTNDDIHPNYYHGSILISNHAHARIRNIDISTATKMPGVKAVITGKDIPILTGPVLVDRPPIAIDVVRYFGEAVALVVARTEQEAKRAMETIQVEYDPLPVLNSPGASLQENASLIHPELGSYKKLGEVHPVPNTNIANHVKIRKGNMDKGWSESEVVVEEKFSFSTSDHAAIEPRCVIVEISPDGNVEIETCSQAPFIIKRLVGRFFNIDIGKITVKVPFVGGAFGGKGSIQLEYLGYIAAKAVGGHPVKIANKREEDMITSPCHIGMEARVKLGSTREGMIKAAEITYFIDSGAYSDMAAIITKAAASDCTGPYNIENVHCDSLCVYTNHPYCTAFRGFGHPELTFAIDRTMDILAKRLDMDPIELRMVNAAKPGDLSPNQALLTKGNFGNVEECLARLKEMIEWDAGYVQVIDDHTVRAKGIASIWKASSTASYAGSGAVITFNRDGSLNLSVGAVELGQGTKTTLAQIAAEKFKMDVNKVHVTMEVNTKYNPVHWKTVASSSTYMTGRAVIEAADDAIRKLKRTASIVLKLLPEDLDVEDGKVFWRVNKGKSIEIKDIAQGYTYPSGISIEGQVIGSGNFIQPRLTYLDPETGKGNPGPWRSVGAQAVEVEANLKNYTYRLLNAYSVMDAGTIINPMAAKSQIAGGMSMGLSFASRESFIYNLEGKVLDVGFRNYKLIRFDETPDFFVEFVETPEEDGPFGARGLGEYGVIGMPAALANALSNAFQVELNQLPLTPELIWRTDRSVHHDLV